MPVQWWLLAVVFIWAFYATEASAGCSTTDFCCIAGKLWQDLEVSGGCNGKNAQSTRCQQAERYCRQCQSQKTHLWQANPGSSTANQTFGEGLVLSSLTLDYLELRCVSPTPPKDCALKDSGVGIVFVAGVVLLVVLVSVAMAFDTKCAPFLVYRFTRSWGMPSNVEAPSYPPPPSAPEPPEQVDMFSTEFGCGIVALRDAASVPSLPTPPKGEPPQVLPSRKRPSPLDMPASPREADATCNLGDAAKVVDSAPLPSITTGYPVANIPKSMREESAPADCVINFTSSSARWPPRLARLWAYRVTFLWVASFAVFARLTHITLTAVIAYHRNVVLVLAEIFVCLVPYTWIALTSKPPSDASGGIPHSSGYVCGRVPRFALFVVATVVLEIYSATAAAWSVTSTSCTERPWRSIAVYCFNIPVVVARTYSALLAVRLQDRFAHATRRVLPFYKSEKAPNKLNDRSKGDSSLTFTDLTNIEPEAPDIETQPLSPSAALGQLGVARKIETEIDIKAERSTDDMLPRDYQKQGTCRCLRRCVFMACSNSREPSPMASPSSQSSAGGTWCQRLRRRLHIRSKSALALTIGLVIVLVAGSSLIWAFHAHKSVKTEKPLPSSCSTAQNATATCAHFESVGDNLWDTAAGDTLSGSADTQEDCCRGCDNLANCQGWMFERVAKRCRWIRFLEEPCASNPGDLRCRCVTHFQTTFGFRPSSQIVWVRREAP